MLLIQQIKIKTNTFYLFFEWDIVISIATEGYEVGEIEHQKIKLNIKITIILLNTKLFSAN